MTMNRFEGYTASNWQLYKNKGSGLVAAHLNRAVNKALNILIQAVAQEKGLTRDDRRALAVEVRKVLDEACHKPSAIKVGASDSEVRGVLTYVIQKHGRPLIGDEIFLVNL